MGSVASKAANGIGAILGNAVVAPIKTLFGANCQNVCSGTWDIGCFIEHLCVADIVKLVLVFFLAYITLMFIYLLFQLGIVQCIIKSLCKIGWAVCETYWYALGDITRFIWRKIKNTKRVHRYHCQRQRFNDVEKGYNSSSDEYNSYYDNSASLGKKQQLIIEKRRKKMQSSFHFVSHGSRDRYRSHKQHHDTRLKTSVVSRRLKGGSGRMRSSRQLQVRRLSSSKLHKKRRIKR